LLQIRPTIKDRPPSRAHDLRRCRRQPQALRGRPRSIATPPLERFLLIRAGGGTHMAPLHKILVPVDFADGARAALDLATTMARKLEASIDLFHVWQPPSILPSPLLVVLHQGGAPQPADDVARSIAGARLNELAADVRKAGVRDVRCHVGIGDPAHDICDLAQSGSFDLIVMGTHARTGRVHALLGSVAEKVVRRAPCPVVTVRAAS
jgi:nucleotide-binding universal stress UspA family protein